MIGGRGNEKVKRRGGKDGLIEGRGKEGVLRLSGKEGLKGRGKYRRTGVNKSAESTKIRGRRKERVKGGGESWGLECEGKRRWRKEKMEEEVMKTTAVWKIRKTNSKRKRKINKEKIRLEDEREKREWIGKYNGRESKNEEAIKFDKKEVRDISWRNKANIYMFINGIN